MIPATYTRPGVPARLLQLSRLRNRERALRRNARFLRSCGAHVLADHWERCAAQTFTRAKALERGLQ